MNKSIRTAKKKQKKNNPFKNWAIGLAAAAAIFLASINVSPTLAQSLSTIPVLGSIVQVGTIKEIKVAEDTYTADIKTPSVTGFENTDLENLLNEKYITENEALYEGFQKEMEALQAVGEDNLIVASNYEVLTDTDDILSISRYEVNAEGSTFTTKRTDTIDKKNEILITLPSLFKDDAYIEIISTYIKEDMIKQMESDEKIVYWIQSEEEIGFDAIRPDQTFSITANHKLIISFDKYEVAPGSSGVITFEIPTEVIASHLVSDYYIK